LYAATWTEYALPDDFAVTVFAAAVAGGDATSVFVFVTGGGGDGAGTRAAAADTIGAGFDGTVSIALVSLAELALAIVGVEGAVATAGAVAVTAGIEVAVSTTGGFTEATDAAGDGQRCP